MHFLLKKTFENRKYSGEFLREIENGQYDQLYNIDAFAEHLHQIKIANKNITIMSDFDTDGINSGIIGYAGLAELGFNVSLFVPDPKEGYEITPKIIDRMLSEYPNTDVILTCDVGITCFNGVDYAKSKGITVLITDHHLEQEKPDNLIGPDCIVDPMQYLDTYAHPKICGAFVLYQCLQYYTNKYYDYFLQEQIKRLRVFAGIGTISDIMPVLYENRHLVRETIGIIKMIYFGGDDYIVSNMPGCEIYRRAFYGLYLLVKEFAEEKKIETPDDINEEFLGFQIAPVLNSVKRMNEDMKLAFGIFFGPDSKENAKRLIALNEERKELVKKYSILLKSENRSQKFFPFIYITDAPSGILGLLANELMSITGQPAIVVRIEESGKFHGSGRSPKWYPFLERTSACGFFAAGHNSAFGIKLKDIDELERLYAFLQTDVENTYDYLITNKIITEPVYDFVIAQDGTGDTCIDIAIFAEYLNELEHYRPFGAEFEIPNILLKCDVSSITEDDIKTIGSEKQHLKITIDYGLEILFWNQAENIESIKNNNTLMVSGYLQESEFLGKNRISFIGTIIE